MIINVFHIAKTMRYGVVVIGIVPIVSYLVFDFRLGNPAHGNQFRYSVKIRKMPASTLIILSEKGLNSNVIPPMTANIESINEKPPMPTRDIVPPRTISWRIPKRSITIPITVTIAPATTFGKQNSKRPITMSTTALTDINAMAPDFLCAKP